LALALFVIKVARQRRMTIQETRRREYVAALGELIAGNTVPPEPPQGWADDTILLEVLFDYLGLVTGAERATIDGLIDVLDLRPRLAEEVRHGRTKRHRLRALTFLVEVADDRQRPLFRESLSSRVAEIRLHAARGLAAIGDTDSIPDLLRVLPTETPWNMGRLADMLVAFGPAAVPALIEHLEAMVDSPPRDAIPTREVIRAVGLIGSLEAEPALRQMLGAAHPLLRTAAASALADCGTPASVPDLLTALRDTSWRVRARAADALGVFADERAVEPLAGRLRDHSWWVRQNAAKALAETSDGLARLVAALDDDDRFMRHVAAFQLGTIEALRAVRHRVESGIASPLDRRIHLAASETLEDLVADDHHQRETGRSLDGDGVVERFVTYGDEEAFALAARLQRLRRSLATGALRFPSFREAGGSGPYLAGGSGGGGFRPVGGQFANRRRLQREEQRVREALVKALAGEGES
jgi:HEAT repeat protein